MEIERLFVDFATEKLNSYRDSLLKQGYPEYNLYIANVKDFREQATDGVNVIFTFGSAKKVEGSKKTRVNNFNAQIWSELNTDGSWVENLFDMFFEEYAKEYIELGNGTWAYADFGNLAVIEQHELAEGGERVKYAIQGQLIYSDTVQIGCKYSLKLDDTTYDIEPIAPRTTTTQNRETNSSTVGIVIVDTSKGLQGQFSLILDDSTLTEYLLDFSYKKQKAKSFSLNFEYPSKTITLDNLKFSNVTSALDESTKNTILAVSFIQYDLEG